MYNDLWTINMIYRSYMWSEFVEGERQELMLRGATAFYDLIPAYPALKCLEGWHAEVITKAYPLLRQYCVPFLCLQYVNKTNQARFSAAGVSRS